MSLPDLRAQFPVTEHSIYLDHAAVSPISLRVQAAMLRQTSMQSNHIMSTRPHFTETYARLREAIGRLVGTSPGNVAFIQNTSHGLSLIANGQPWQPGDNVVVPAMDFPSNFLVWKRLESLGVECRTVEVPDGRITPEVISKALDARTRIVALSAVQYYNGYRPDLAAIADVVHRNGSFLVADGTQGVGAFRADLSEHAIDALVVSAHKWMLGPLGVGFMAMSGRLLERTEVTQVGWLSVEEPFAFRRELELLHTAERFEPGTENSAGLFGLYERLREIEEFGLQQISERILSLTDRLADRLRGLGCVIDSPWETGRRSGILTFRHSALDTDAVVQSLKARRFYVSARHGNLRVSPHYYNSESEIDGFAEQIENLVTSGHK
ncbi:aminotransferase class V-fold PLP-dependent enzyme [Nisaea sp.]|uniref:aminotransferase class V-fold PLP-dependent enzyme n=1 Tax=Nisaea sp. TaxID=2024842 RepID=UPI0032668366